MFRSGLQLFAAGAALFLVAACSGDNDASSATAPKIDYQTGVAAPADRSAEAVSSALARIDPCALIDPTGADVKGFPKASEIDRDGPHVCEVVSPDYSKVRAVVGNEVSAEDRFSRDLQTLGGAKAYIESTTSTFCRVALPVSFTHAIEFVGSDSGVGADACRATKRVAALAATRLAEPETVEQPAGPARTTACDILSQAIELKKNREFRFGADFLRGMDECGVWEGSGKKLGVSGLQLSPVAPQQHLEIEYSTPPNDEFSKDYGTVRGRELNGYSSGGCVLAWNEWDGPQEAGQQLVARFRVSAAKCRQAKRLVSKVTEAIDDGSAEPSAPQEPVLYAPDEPDVDAPGGCVDLAGYEEADCKALADEELADLDIPEDAAALARAAGDEPSISCAIAIDSVREHFGDEMSPITAVNGIDVSGEPDHMCAFTEPSHSRQVWIDISPEPMVHEPSSKIGGHEAHDETAVSDGTRQAWIAIGDAEDDGHVYAEVRVTPDRSTGMYSDSPVDDKPLDDLDETVADLMDASF